MEVKTHYQTLEVEPTATHEQIAQAYRRLARTFHPDLQPVEAQGWAHEQMKRLNAAYEVLGDPRVRARYDADLASQAERAATATRRADVVTPDASNRSTGQPIVWIILLALLPASTIYLLLKLRGFAQSPQTWDYVTAAWVAIWLPLLAAVYRLNRTNTIKVMAWVVTIPFVLIGAIFLIFGLSLKGSVYFFDPLTIAVMIIWWIVGVASIYTTAQSLKNH